jgi:hypothetical protein
MPEVLFLNSPTAPARTSYGSAHPGPSAPMEVVCKGTFPALRVAHRGDVVADVVQAALSLHAFDRGRQDLKALTDLFFVRCAAFASPGLVQVGAPAREV